MYLPLSRFYSSFLTRCTSPPLLSCKYIIIPCRPTQKNFVVFCLLLSTCKVDVFQPAHLIIQPIKLSLNVQFDWLVGVTIRLKAEWKCTSMEPGEECVDTVTTGI